MGAGWAAVAASVPALATNIPATISATNQRFMGGFLPYFTCRKIVAPAPPTHLQSASNASPALATSLEALWKLGASRGVLKRGTKIMSVIDLASSPTIAAETDPIFERVEAIIPRVEWPLHAPYVAAINRLKRERNAIILAHNYQVPEIFYTVADIVGDSLALAMKASQTDADVIVLCGVHFMAETAKLVNPRKTVLVPDLRAGCSLAESITAADVRLLRKPIPETPIVTYVNTSAEVKAESDVCVTSGNAVEIVEALKAPRVVFLPDEYLAKYVASKTNVEIIAWKGHCEVHERFTGADIRRFPRRRSGANRASASGVPAGRARRGRLRRLDAGHDGVRRHARCWEPIPRSRDGGAQRSSGA